MPDQAQPQYPMPMHACTMSGLRCCFVPAEPCVSHYNSAAQSDMVGARKTYVGQALALNVTLEVLMGALRRPQALHEVKRTTSASR